MQKPTPEKLDLQGASAKAPPEMGAAKPAPKPATAKPVEPDPTNPSSEAESHTRSC